MNSDFYRRVLEHLNALGNNLEDLQNSISKLENTIESLPTLSKETFSTISPQKDGLEYRIFHVNIDGSIDPSGGEPLFEYLRQNGEKICRGGISLQHIIQGLAIDDYTEKYIVFLLKNNEVKGFMILYVGEDPVKAPKPRDFYERATKMLYGTDEDGLHQIYIRDICIDPSLKGQNLGLKMIQIAEELAKQIYPDEDARLWLDTAPMDVSGRPAINQNLVNTFKNFGFTDEGAAEALSILFRGVKFMYKNLKA